MPRAKGPIGYIEHRTPMKDESGKYIVHPMFIQKGTYDLENMMNESQGHCMVNAAQFLSVENVIEDLTLQALADGKSVRLGDMLTIRPKLRLLRHMDEEKGEYSNTYTEGERIPADEVEVYGFDIQPTKEFCRRFMTAHFRGCSRQEWSVRMQPAAEDREAQFVVEQCREHGYVTVKDFILKFGVSYYHARKVLDSYCCMPGGWLKTVKKGALLLYAPRTEGQNEEEQE